jgi:SAM-dependent methyltransferase
LNPAAGTLYAAALADARGGWRLLIDGHEARPLLVDRWTAPCDEVDERTLQRAQQPVLDVGCGPGRHVHALARRGVMALGIDASEAALALARRRGSNAVLGSVFGHVPGAGTWGSALLLDDNLGIGGDPVRLLRRVATLLRPGGTVLVECDAPGGPTGPVTARMDGPAGTSDPFAWAVVAADGVDAVAAAAGLTVEEAWEDGERYFAALR